MAANPIGLVVIAIAGLVAGLVVAYKKVGWFRAFVDGSFRAVKAAFFAMAEGFKWAWQNIVQPVWNAAQTAIRIYLTPLRLAFEALKIAFGVAMQGLRWYWNNFAKPVFNSLKVGIGLVRVAFVAFRDAAVAVWNRVVEVFGWVQDRLQPVWNFIQSLIDAADRAIGLARTAAGLASKIPGAGGGVPFVPFLAHGGVVTRPTLAVVGEAGPEAVIPLSRLRDTRPGGSTTTVTVNVTAPPGADQTYIRWLSDQILRAARDGGPLATAIRQVV